MSDLKMLPLNDFPVLILGETGTGKSYYAKKYFENYKNYFDHFCQLNISSLNPNLFESEMFGHKKGSFTGADKNKIGFCEKVNKGVLFLDEIGELSLEQQAKLLTLIDERIYYPVGSNTPQKFFGKLLFATNRDLEQMVEKKEFREDLYFRIRFYQLKALPLREYRNLKSQILSMASEYRIKITEDVLLILLKYNWPGNFRELKQTMQYFSSLGYEYISRRDVPEWLLQVCDGKREMLFDFNYNKAEFEKNFLIKALKINTGKINQTSDFIGLNKVTLISKLKKYGIDKNDYKFNLDRERIASGF